ncbi:MAG: tripartite tricarboxylate transporter substrate binding protein [Betaproteobacteria bacterium]|jgi:tripartite-type tricarboxylate transporter receptor subunit TctC
MNYSFPQILFSFLCTLVSILFIPLHAQNWPTKPVRIIVPYAPAGNTDAIARLVAERLSSVFSQSFVVENKPGAGGATAAEYVSKSAPDGYTLFLAALSQFGPVPVTQKVNYDPINDFTPIGNVAANGFVIAVSSKLPVENLTEYIAYVKARPNKLNYGTGGTGSMTHLAPLLFLKRAGIEMVHIPYKGGAPALADLLSGQVEMYAGSPSELIPLMSSGRFKTLAITSLNRNAQMPNVPPIADFYPGFKAETWNGLLGPANMSPAVVDKLSSEIQKLLKDPEVLAKLGKFGLEPVYTTPSSFLTDIKNDHLLWKELIKSSQVVVD